MNFTDENGICLQLDQHNFTASVIESPILIEDIIIPRKITYQSNDYIIT